MIRKDRIRLWIVLVVVVGALLYSWPIVGRVNLGLDLKGGSHIVLQAKRTAESPVGDDDIDRLLAVVRNRIDQYGVAEPIIQKGGFDRVIIDLPGIQDPAAALELIGKTAVLEFREVLDIRSLQPIPQPARSNYDDDEGFEAARGRWQGEMDKNNKIEEDFAERAAGIKGAIVSHSTDDNEPLLYLLGEVLVAGKDLSDALRSNDSYGRAAVSLSFNNEGARAFSEATGRLIEKQLAIVLDGVTLSAPVVRSHIRDGNAQISGRYTADEAARMAIMLRAGALPVAVEVAENRSVGPSLGADSIRQSLQAGVVGSILIFVFMLIYYRLSGLAANVAMSVTVLLVFAGLIAFRATLTLPGIAAIILTIGMSIDGNVLIYERIKEELRAGKTPLAALEAGFRRALITILDSNITGLIAAVVLFYFGAGPIRGFGVTLSIGLVTSVFSNVVVTRALLQLFMRQRASALKRS